ncbi:hypothetical protein IPV69_17545 [Humisphaera borealis]|uniref:Uncharacterized protein n=2 Tax=Humisphaera borealis TaxID=2807512 RepID=A0A7M2X3W4_9BACT|nr:hypothetical protein IPV69_17545 [Humisphaera borealis]
MAGAPASIPQQIFWLLILSMPVACVARTVVFEEVFREPREFCRRQCRDCQAFLLRKFFYLFTCEYCFSHYVAAGFVALTDFKLLLSDWRGYVISIFATVIVANTYLNLYARLRVDITQAKVETRRLETALEGQTATDDRKDV